MIKWKKWIDPSLLTPQQTPEEIFPEEEEDDETGDEGPSFIPFRFVSPPPHPDLAPSAHWNIWVGHSRQVINEDLGQAIAETVGVEALEVNSPYRFHLAVGQAFDEDEVKRSVERVFAARSPEPASLSRLAAVRYPYYAVLLMGDGTQEIVGGQSRVEVEQRVEFFIREKGAEEAQLSWQ